MKNQIKRFVGFLSMLAMMISLCMPAAFAYSNEIEFKGTFQVTYEEISNLSERISNMSDDEFYEFLIVEYGLIQEDAQELVNFRNSGNFVRPYGLDLPDNPYIGQKVTRYFNIDVDTTLDVIGIANDIAGIFDTSGITELISIALVIAEAIVDYEGIVTVRLSVEYIYGPDNDNYIRWYPGVIKVVDVF